jgi:hypothetical protein
MSLVDKVAQFIYDGYKQSTKNSSKVVSDSVHTHLRDIIDRKHPINTLTLGYRVSVGDVLRPTEPQFIVIPNQNILLLPSHRYVIYSISCPSQFFNISQVECEIDYADMPKTIILVYHGIGCIIPPNLYRIDEVMCLGQSAILLGLLQSCELVGNIAPLLV